MTEPRFAFDQTFDEDYLYFYEPYAAEVTEREVEAIWRLMQLEPGIEVLDLACGHGRIANGLAQRGARVTGLDVTPLFLERAREDAGARGVEVITARATTERTIVREGRVRRFHFSVRMFIAAELHDWLGDAGFQTVEFVDHAGEPLTAHSRRIGYPRPRIESVAAVRVSPRG
jgi:2-polyprenyl-3-methyl-5-hydroxy-6-metoxy-1,4-benzoquinol methylase